MVGRVEVYDAGEMASEILTARNESNWSTSSSHRLNHNHNNNHNHSKSKSKSKFPFVNPNPNPNPNLPNFNPNQNQNQNPGNSSFRKQLPHAINNGTIEEELNSFSHYVNYDISNLSKDELQKLKSQLVLELHKIRTLSCQIEARNVEARNVEMDKQIASKKRPSPFTSSNGNNNGGKRHQSRYVASSNIMKSCATVLRKLSNQKAGIWFNSPVDAVGMGLHDYHTVINRPMDLGTIKGKLDRGIYDSPEEFAEDVRLTFNNALKYNPKGHEVNTFAGQYLALFERWFIPILSKYNAEKQLHFQQIGVRKSFPVPKAVKDDVFVEDEVKKLEFDPKPVAPRPVSPKEPPPRPVSPKEPPPRLVSPKEPSPRPVSPVRREVEVSVSPPIVERSKGGGGARGRPSEGKLPKPKAKDPNKREMSMEEKRKLGSGLQSLPEEKMVQVIQIIRKRNGDLTQDGDEIELDMEAVDTETLWELDRFVTNYKKLVSKINRQALMVNNNVGCGDDVEQAGMSERMVEMTSKAKKVGGGVDVGEEDVDIGGDEMPVNNFPPLEIDKDDDRQGSGSSSSSSGSDDSSSSGSDSGSSSGSDSDVDDAQSCDKESKNFNN